MRDNPKRLYVLFSTVLQLPNIVFRKKNFLMFGLVKADLYRTLAAMPGLVLVKADLYRTPATMPGLVW